MTKVSHQPKFDEPKTPKISNYKAKANESSDLPTESLLISDSLMNTPPLLLKGYTQNRIRNQSYKNCLPVVSA